MKQWNKKVMAEEKMRDCAKEKLEQILSCIVKAT